MTTAQIARDTAVIAKTMRKAGITVKPYQRIPPILGDDGTPFLLTATRDIPLRVWKGEAEVDVHPDRKHHQVVLAANEQHRVLRETVESSMVRSTRVAPDRMSDDWLDSRIRDRARVDTQLAVPGSRRTVTSYRITNHHTTAYQEVWEFAAKVTISVPAREQHFLCGIDETSHFICALPEAAESVDDAHDILRPDRVPEGSPRQGEWFFVPVTEKQAASIEAVNARRIDRYYENLESFSTHQACLVQVGMRRFTRGYVYDTRRGRHAPLWLPDWHEVIRNREIRQTPRQDRDRRTQYWD